ncbi:MAG: hypothetical protein AAGF11_35690 [Myxococcota bacterium]
MVLRDVASRSSPNDGRGRGKIPVGVIGVAALVGLVVAYLSDCIPGLGAGSSLGVPQPDVAAEPAKTSPSDPSPAPAAGPARLSIEVQGERCRQGEAEPAPCPQVCRALDQDHRGRGPSSVVVDVDATQGSHGAVETLRACLKEAGFSQVRVHSE